MTIPLSGGDTDLDFLTTQERRTAIDQNFRDLATAALTTNDTDSRYPRLTTTTPARIGHGYIDGRAGTFATISGDGFTPVRTAAGRYDITFDAAFTTTPAVSLACNCVGSLNVIFFTALSASVLSVGIDDTGGVAQDDLFTFIAIG